MKHITAAVRRHFAEVRLRARLDTGEGGPLTWALGLFFGGTLMLAVYGAAQTAIGQKLLAMAGWGEGE